MKNIKRVINIHTRLNNLLSLKGAGFRTSINGTNRGTERHENVCLILYHNGA